MSYYHYTKGCHLGSIVLGGIIKTTGGMDKKEKPAVWLTKSPEWESACNVGSITNMNELEDGHIYSSRQIHIVTTTNDYMKTELGMCRILISETLPVVTWAKFLYVSGISTRSYYALDRVSKDKGCPVDQWLSSFKPIPRVYWEGVEIFVVDKWVRWDGKMPIVEFIELCMSCNDSHRAEKRSQGLCFQSFAENQAKFYRKHKNAIIKFWEANKHKKGYIEIYVTPDYQPYKCGFRFIEKRVRTSTFKALENTNSTNYALVHFLWEATFTQYRAAIGYEKEDYAKTEKVLALNR